MALQREQKESLIQDLSTAFRDVGSIVFVKYDGLTVSDVESLRNELHEQSVTYRVVKKTLLDRALKEAGMGDISVKPYDGQLAVGYSTVDEVTAAKALDGFAQTHEALQLLGGILNGEVLDAVAVTQLARIPTKEELYAKLVGTIQNPISGFVRVLHGTLAGLVHVLNARRESLEA